MRTNELLRRAAVLVVASAIAGATGTTGARAATEPTLNVAVRPQGTAGLDMYGTPAPLTVSVGTPPPQDAYLRLDFTPAGSGGQLDVEVTDSAGTVLPVGAGPQTGERQVDVGTADSDGDGIPGAPMSAGDVDLGLRALAPTDQGFLVSASLVDGATGQTIHTTGSGAQVALAQPRLTGSWWNQLAQGPYGSGTTVLHGGGTGDAVEYAASVRNVMSYPVPGARVEFTVSAAALAAARLTAAGLAPLLHARFSADTSGPRTAATWSALPDGSLAVLSPPMDLAAGSASQQVNPTLWLTGDAALPSVTSLPFETSVTDGSGQVLASQAGTFRLVTDPSHDMDWDGRADLVVRDTAGRLYLYRGTGDAASPFEPRVEIPDSDAYSSYTGYTVLGPASYTGRPLIVARCTVDHCGNGLGVFMPEFPYAAQPVPALTGSDAGSAWTYYTLQAGVGDVTGDGAADLLSRDSSGVLWISPGTGDYDPPSFHARVRVGSGWNQFNALQGVGDVTGDGHPDLLARDASGVLWLYRGTGRASSPFLPRVRIGSGWGQFTKLAGVGDVTGDGRPDLLARDASGVLWLYRGTGGPSPVFLPRVRIGSGWNQFTDLF